MPEDVVNDAGDINEISEQVEQLNSEISANSSNPMEQQEIEKQVKEIELKKEAKEQEVVPRIARALNVEIKNYEQFKNSIENPRANDPVVKQTDKYVLDVRKNAAVEVEQIQDQVGESGRKIEDSPKTQESLFKKWGKRAAAMIILVGSLAGVTYGILKAIANAMSGCYYEDLCAGISQKICDTKQCDCAHELSLPGQCTAPNLPPIPRCSKNCNNKDITNMYSAAAVNDNVAYKKYYTYKQYNASDILYNIIQAAEQIPDILNPKNISKYLLQVLKTAGIALAITIVFFIIYKVIMSAKK